MAVIIVILFSLVVAVIPQDTPLWSYGANGCSKTCTVVCTDRLADVVFILDSSGSIRDANPQDGSYDNWQLMLDFVVNIVQRLKIGEDHIHVGLVSFSHSATVHFKLDSHYDKRRLIAAIRNIPYQGTTTQTAAALEVTRNQVFDPGFDDQRGDRSDVPNLAIIITDGQSTNDPRVTIQQADQAKLNQINMFAVGITESVNIQELKDISSTSVKNESYWVTLDFWVAEEVIEGILNETCKVMLPDWLIWNEWTSCSKSCNGGMQSRRSSCEIRNSCIHFTWENDRRRCKGEIKCEGTVSQQKRCNLQPCRACVGQQADVVFVLDSSGSIKDANPKDLSYDNWVLVLEFIVKVITRLPIGEDGVHIGLVKYSGEAVTEITLDEYYEKDQLIQVVRGLNYVGGDTNTAAGLLEMRTAVFGGSGDREDAPNIGIVITDGGSTLDKGNTIPYAKHAEDDGIFMLAVGITNKVNETELAGISATGKKGVTYWTSPDFTVTDAIIQNVVNRTCSQGESDVTWLQWTQWTHCSTSCGIGFQQRIRQCVGQTCPAPIFQQRQCMTQQCSTEDMQPAPVSTTPSTKSTTGPTSVNPDGRGGRGIPLWTSWSLCPCTGGYRTRVISCNTDMCKGVVTQTVPCATHRCYPDTGRNNTSPWPFPRNHLDIIFMILCGCAGLLLGLLIAGIVAAIIRACRKEKKKK